MAKMNFPQPLLQSSVSHDPSEIIIINFFKNIYIFLTANIWKVVYKSDFNSFIIASTDGAMQDGAWKTENHMGFELQNISVLE